MINKKTLDDLIANLMDKEMIDEKTIDALMVRIIGKDWKNINLNDLPEHEKMKLIEKAYAFGKKEGGSSGFNN